MRNARWVRPAILAASVVMLSSCTSAAPKAAQPPTSTPPGSGQGVAGGPAPGPSRPALCNGTAGQALVRGLFADLSGGREPSMSRYFTTPVNFLRWVDPYSVTDITFTPAAANDGSVDLDVLEKHLDGLARGGFSVKLVTFTDGGFDGGGTPDAGGWFDFTAFGKGRKSETPTDGGGKGAVDCATGKLKALVLDSW